jgi:mannose-6-phosphate isomerase-like protein (cupin superfamily)
MEETMSASPVYSKRQLEDRNVARFNELEPLTDALFGQFLPNSQASLYKIINRGTADNPKVKPKIKIPHSFATTITSVPPGQGAPLHAHETEEVFFVLNGSMVFLWGDEGENEITLNKWDTLSMPKHVMRGFENRTEETVNLYVVIGGPDEVTLGSVTYAPHIVEKAQEIGLMDKNGKIIPRK